MNKYIITALLLTTSLIVRAMEISEYVTLEGKQQGAYIIGFLDTKTIDASNSGYNSYCAERWGVNGAFNAIKAQLQPGPNGEKPINFNVALILEIAFKDYCKSIEDENGNIGPQ